MSSSDDKSITNQSSNQLDGVVDNLTVTNALVLNNPLAIAYGGTGLSSVGTAGQVLTSTGSGLQYTTPAGGGGGVAAVTASPPLFSSGGTAPNISCISTTGSGSVVLATAPIITASLTVASVTTPAQTVVTDMSSVGTGIIRTSSDAFGLDISSGGYGLGNLKRVRLLADTVTVTNSALTLGSNNFFNVTLPTNITTTYCSDILNFTNVNNTSNNSTQGISMYTSGSPSPARLKMGIRSGANYPATKNTYFEINDDKATFDVYTGTGNTAFTSTDGEFSAITTGTGGLFFQTLGSGDINFRCETSGGIQFFTQTAPLGFQSGAEFEIFAGDYIAMNSATSIGISAPSVFISSDSLQLISPVITVEGDLAITGITAITGVTTITGATTVIGLLTTNELTVVGVTALGGAVGIAGLLGVTGSANFTGLNLFANVAGNVSLTSVLNADLVSGSGAVKIAADLGGVSIGGNGYGSVGNFQVNSKSGTGAFQTGNVSFLIEKTASETGPGNFSIDTLGAITGDMTIATKGLVSIRSNASTNSIRLNTAFITPSSYNWSYPSTAGTLNSLLLSGAGSAAMTWLAPGASATVLTSNGTALSWQPVSALSVDWTIPGTIGSTTPNTGAFTTLRATASNTTFATGVLTVTNTATGSGSAAAFLSPNLASGNATVMLLGKNVLDNSGAYFSFGYNTTPSLISSTWGFGNGVPGNFIRLNGDSSITMNGGISLNGSINMNGQISSTLPPGTPPFSVTSTTLVPNLNVGRLLSQTWAEPAPIGATTPSTGAFTTLSASQQITSTLVAGTAPFNVVSTTMVTNLNANLLQGRLWEVPGEIGSFLANTGAFTALTATASNSVFTQGVLSVTNLSSVSASVATFMTPTLGAGEASNLIMGKGFGNSQAMYISYAHSANPILVSSTWGFGNSSPSTAITMRGTGDISFQFAGTQVTLNPSSVSASKTLCLDSGKGMISRIGGSNTIYETSAPTVVAGSTFENIGSVITVRTKGNGTLSWVDRGTGFKNQSGENLLVSISFTANRDTTGVGNSSFRIILNNSIILAQQDIGGGSERITISAMTYLDNLETFQCQVRCINTVIYTGIIVTINTYPLVE